MEEKKLPIPKDFFKQFKNKEEFHTFFNSLFKEGVEEMLKGFINTTKPIHGRLDGFLPRDGELNPNIVAKALGVEMIEGQPIPELVKQRPPHRKWTVTKLMQVRISQWVSLSRKHPRDHARGQPT